MRERIPQRGDAVKHMFKVSRLIGFAIVPKRRRLIDNGRRWSEGARPAGNGRIHRGGIDERLEDGPGLALCEHVVKLARAIIASAHQSLDRSRVRVERDQGDLCFGKGDVLMTLLFFEQIVDELHPDTYRVVGGALQIQVQRRIDAIGFGLEIIVLKTVLQLVVHQVYEVRSIARFGAAR